jgi:Domain of unknown function (DUF6504)
MDEQFICDPIKVITDDASVSGALRGEPCAPKHFIWRTQEIEVAEVLDRWKDTGPCTHGSAEKYVRKHWFKIRADDNRIMKIYFERKPRSMKKARERWWLYTISMSD